MSNIKIVNVTWIVIHVVCNDYIFYLIINLFVILSICYNFRVQWNTLLLSHNPWVQWKMYVVNNKVKHKTLPRSV